MKKWLFLCFVVLLGGLPAVATNLVVKPLQGADYRQELATIGKVVYHGDSLYLYDGFGTVLYKEQLTKVQQLHYSESSEPTTGTAETHADRLQLRVFPNPTASTLTVESALAEGGQLLLYNQQGQLLKTETVGGGRTTLDVSDLSAGTYLLLCKSEVFKVIKE